MRENKLRVKIPATAESSRSSGQSIILKGTEGCPRSGTMQLWRRRSHYINRDGRMLFLRANSLTTLVPLIVLHMLELSVMD